MITACLILAASVGYINASGIGSSCVTIVILLIGLSIPRNPRSPNHPLSPSVRVYLAEIFVTAMVVYAFFTVVGGFAAYFYVKSFAEDYCKDCIAENCGCDDMCRDDFNTLKALSFVFLSIGIVLSLITSMSLARWTQGLMKIMLREHPHAKNGFSDLILSIPLYDTDGYFCCCCPGVDPACTSRRLEEAQDDIADAVKDAQDDIADAVKDVGESISDGISDARDAAYSLLETIAPLLCCCCFLTSFVIAVVLCYSESVPDWLQLISCIYAFIVYVFLDGSGGTF